jgi:hypothetical protein|tara:strand:+ start:727 stop:1629 length:903 start_codon:yes stop_codon:yes gene_type:complete
MANTNTNISKELIQVEILPALQLGLVPLDVLSFKSVADAPLYYGDTVRVPVTSARTAGTFAGNWETGDSTTTGTDVTIGKPIFTAAYIDPTEEMPTASRLLALGKECAYGTAKKVLQDVLALFVEANIGSGAGDESVIASGAYDHADVADMRKKLWDKGVEGSIAAINDLSYVTNLYKDAAIIDQSASGASTLTTGELPPLYGIRQFYTDAFPTAVTSENTHVILTGPTTAAVAMGVPGDPTGLEGPAGIRTTVASDADTGLALSFRQWVNSATGFHWVAVYVMKGQSFVQDAAVRVVSA